MKRILGIGIALLFILVLIAVQPGYSTPVLVDDDVGLIFVTGVDQVSLNYDEPVVFASVMHYTQGEGRIPIEIKSYSYDYDMNLLASAILNKSFSMDCKNASLEAQKDYTSQYNKTLINRGNVEIEDACRRLDIGDIHWPDKGKT